MKAPSFSVIVAVCASCAASAVDLSGLADLHFAEKYAFSTNRAALIETLRPGTKAWFTYSILNAQVEGRLDEAERLLEQWRRLPDQSPEADPRRRSALDVRNALLAFGDCTNMGETGGQKLSNRLGECGVYTGVPVREVELKPNTYPPELSQDAISFDAFSEVCNSLYDGLEPRFRFIGFLMDPLCADLSLNRLAVSEINPPDTPGVFEHIVEHIRCGMPSLRVKDMETIFDSLMPAQLEALARAFKDDPQRCLTGDSPDADSTKAGGFSDMYIAAVLEKITAGADEEPDDPAVRESVLKRRMTFVKSLGDAVRDRYLAKTERELLEFYLSCGAESAHLELFADYLSHVRMRSPVRGDSFMAAYIAAARRAGFDVVGACSGCVDPAFVAKTVAEADLLAGKPSAEVDVESLTSAEYDSIQKRVELDWAKSNPRRFAADDDVELAIDVKNVPKMRIAVFELDASAACREAKGEVAAEIDLDCAIPTHERFLEFGSVPSALRHRETLAFPELKQPGLYVVECSGQGVASRAFVRKGRLRAVERRDASGHVFAALDEKGRIVKDSLLRLGETVFRADENGEIPVPFAATEKDAGRKTAIVEAGRLATAVVFHHDVERYELEMGAVLPVESLVAGREATALLRPTLKTSGVKSSLAILENPVLTVMFVDGKGRESVKKFPDFKVSDVEESVCRFRVPRGLSRVVFRLDGSVSRMTRGEKTVRVSAGCGFSANGIASTERVEQLFMRRTSGGCLLECRGRTGEPVPHRAIRLKFKHRAFSGDWKIGKMMQFDDDGVLDLGALVDIETVGTDDFGGYEWPVESGVLLQCGASGMNIAEGETVEVPVRGLLDGAWPGAGELRNRVSLLSVDGRGRYLADCIGACSYSNGVLRIAGLSAGDYKLRLRTETCPTVDISVARTAGCIGDGGVVSGETRALTDTGDPSRLRIDDAYVASNGVLRVRLAGADADARVHVFASRTAWDPVTSVGGTWPREPQPRAWKWGDADSRYISGRDLGDKLRYILDRRQEPGRIGNMLERPSLLLNPWTTSDTKTKEVGLSDGAAWEAAGAAPEPAYAPLRGAGDAEPLRAPLAGGAFPCRDFLPEAAAVFANLKPGSDGAVEADMSGAAGMQDLVVVATDGRTRDEVRLLGDAVHFKPRDLRANSDASAPDEAGRSKSYSTIGELHALMSSLSDAGRDTLLEFSFIADWSAKGFDKKVELYGKYASHELDFFLHEKDRAFFDAVVAPNLRNKRRLDFMDRWLLGEDLSQYAAPGRLQDLNAFEQCLLARCVKTAAPVVAKALADWCEANPVDPDEEDRRLAVALDDMESEDADACELLAAEPEPSACGSRSPDSRPMRGNSREMELLRRAEVQRRGGRQRWSPPERTKEWVESNWYRRRDAAGELSFAGPGPFWRDYAQAVAGGREESFRSPAIIYAAGSFSEAIAAIAATKVGFEAQDGAAVVVSRRSECADGTSCRTTFKLDRHFFERGEKDADGSDKEAVDEFVCGRVYADRTVLMNPTSRRCRVRVFSRIPDGAFPVGGCAAFNDTTVDVGAYGIAALPDTLFYFPKAESGIGRAEPPCAYERGAAFSGVGEEFACNVVAETTKCDTNSWRYISQKGTSEEALDYLRSANLVGVDLTAVGWRYADGGFARKALEILEGRGVYCQPLWLAGLQFKDAFDASRIREALSRRENRMRLADALGPVFKTPLVDIEPEDSGVFEHKEYWPIVNARTHAKGGAATIANDALAAEWRAFVDVLAAKAAPSGGDRLLAAVYLISQDRVAEAEGQLAAVGEENAAGMKMQTDYLKAYLAFSRGDAKGARELAAAWTNAPSPVWRGRFRGVVAQADEIASGVAADAAGGEAAAPSIAIRAEAKDGVPEGLLIAAGGLSGCVVKAYPVDVEIAFSKNPFGGDSAATAGILGMRPAWSAEVALGEDGEARVALPKALRRTNLVLVATGADGRAEDRIEVTPGSLVVQVVRERRQLRVSDGGGRPLAGAYVKVYARDAAGLRTKFHKDGYTDLRGVFDYASVSTDSEFRPAEFAVFVSAAGAGVKTLRTPAAD